jgi:hypothetical protein
MWTALIAFGVFTVNDSSASIERNRLKMFSFLLWQKILRASKAHEATLLGMRQVLSARFAERRKRLGAYAAPD